MSAGGCQFQRAYRQHGGRSVRMSDILDAGPEARGAAPARLAFAVPGRSPSSWANSGGSGGSSRCLPLPWHAVFGIHIHVHRAVGPRQRDNLLSRTADGLKLWARVGGCQ